MTNLNNQVADTSSIIFFAFRYALGRKTYVTSLVSKYIRNNWNLLLQTDQDLIFKELKITLEKNDNLGMEIDKQEWLELYNWIYFEKQKGLL